VVGEPDELRRHDRMSFSEDQGYLPATIDDLMELVREGLNDAVRLELRGRDLPGHERLYNTSTRSIQRLQENEIKTSEIVLKLQQYFHDDQ
jgi:hypothetical protein